MYASFSSKKEAVLADVMAQLSDSGAPAYKDCDEDMQHISVILSVLYLPRMQQSFRKIRLIPMILHILRGENDESISLYTYLNYAISKNWIDTSKTD